MIRTRRETGRRRGAGVWALVLASAIAAVIALGSLRADANDFDESIARIDEAIRKNPSNVPESAVDSCLKRRNFAMRLHQAGEYARAERSMKFCFDVLGISETASAKDKKAGAAESMQQIQARAAREVERALHLEPNIENGLEIYRSCAMCHMPEGWGQSSGLVPQIAGQHHTVVIKQLADIRAGNRENVLMLPYSSVESIGGTQSVADVAGYIDTLEISVDTDEGPGTDLELGEKLYAENCARCHGPTGEGDAAAFVPRIQAQHYAYLVRQFEAIRDGRRRNANPEMVLQIQSFEDRETHAVLDYVSRLEPPEELQAPPDWQNPDFAD